MSEAYRHPGFAFIERYEEGLPATKAELARCARAYGRFLRQEAEVSETIPVDLDRIEEAFGLEKMPADILEDGPDIQGIAAQSQGLIFVRADDPRRRRRFTRAHELMELLFGALAGNQYEPELRPYVEGPKKERLCDWGAARLLMPKAPFTRDLRRSGLSLPSGSALADRYGTSLVATLMRMTELWPEPQLFLVWRRAHKPSQKREIAAANQGSLFEEGYRHAPEKRLRIWYGRLSKGCRRLHIPIHKSVPEDSLIGRVFEQQERITGHEEVDLSTFAARCRVEARPASFGETEGVISLIGLPPSYRDGSREEPHLPFG